ncbi:hypothetical protein LCGC14_1257390, partial [marine sediment metagenome]
MASKKWDFSDWTDLNEVNCYGGNFIVTDSDPLQFNLPVLDTRINKVYGNNLPSAVTDGDAFNIYVRMRTNQVLQDVSYLLFVELGGGNFLFGTFFQAGLPGVRRFFRSSPHATPVCGTYWQSLVQLHTFTNNQWTWFKVYLRPNVDPTKTDISFFYNDEGGTTRPGNWTRISSFELAAQDFSLPPSEIGVYVETFVSLSSIIVQADDLEIETFSIIGGPSTWPDVNWKSIQFLSQIGGGGKALIELEDEDFNDWSTILALQRKTFTINDSQYGLEHFRGEVVRTIPRRNGALIELEDISRKLVNTLCDHNPIVADHLVERVKDNTIHYNGANRNGFPFNTTSVYGVTFQKLQPKKVIMYPSNKVYWDKNSDAWIPDYALGTDDTLFYDDDGGSDSNNSIGFMHETDESAIEPLHLVLLWNVFLKENTVIKSCILNLKYRNMNPGLNLDYEIEIYDFNGALWTKIIDIETLTSEGQIAELNNHYFSFQKALTVELVGLITLTDHMFAQGAVNSSGFQEWFMRIAMTTVPTNTDFQGAIFDFASLEFTLDIDQHPGEGLGQLTSSTATLVTLAAPAW